MNIRMGEVRPEHTVGGKYSVPGQEFVRDSRYIKTRITANGGTKSGGWDPITDTYPVEGGERYRLVAARACPWANRAIIVRRLLGLEDAISLGLPGPTHDARSWTFDLDPDGVDQCLELSASKTPTLSAFLVTRAASQCPAL